jgi:hypothetical protein
MNDRPYATTQGKMRGERRREDRIRNRKKIQFREKAILPISQARGRYDRTIWCYIWCFLGLEVAGLGCGC